MRPLAVFVLLVAAPALAQSPVYGIVEVEPVPVGGMEAVEARVAYPPQAARAGLHGSALVRATGGADGRVVDAACDTAPSRALCAAAAEAVRASPFQPGQTRGRAVATRLTLSVGLRPPAASGAPAVPVARLARGAALRVEYPEMARRAGVEGRVFVQFIVDEQGNVSQAECVRSPDPLLCDAAKAAVEASTFRLVIQRGRPVKARFMLPVDFKLL